MRPVTLGIHSTTRRTFSIPTIAIAVSFFGIAGPAGAQSGIGVLVGSVHDSANVAVAGARVDVVGIAVVGVATSPDGSFRLVNIPAGPRTVVVHRLGFAPDSARVEIAAGGTTVHNFVLAPAAVNLASVVVRASPRMAETKAGALAVEQNAPNIVSALSGDEIRSLPNFNAAEAAGRIPGISLERDEGEGKFVQVRGTEPRLSNVTINGAHVPGTESSRIAKLDDVPSDLLASIEVTKTPEDSPRGYVAGQYGQTVLAGRNTYQGGFTYGGRYGQDGRLGFLLGGSADRNNRAIDDIEPVWGLSGGTAEQSPDRLDVVDRAVVPVRRTAEQESQPAILPVTTTVGEASLIRIASGQHGLPVLPRDVTPRRVLGGLRHEVDRAADRVGFHVRSQRLRDLDRRQQVGRDVVQLGDAGGLGAGDMRAVDGDVGQPRLGAAHLHELAFALVTLERDTGDAACGFRCIEVGERADFVARERGDDVRRVLLDRERPGLRLGHARRGAHHDAREIHGGRGEHEVVDRRPARGDLDAGGIGSEPEPVDHDRARTRGDVHQAERAVWRRHHTHGGAGDVNPGPGDRHVRRVV